jgi:vacuolar-type H+-ATPase subunit C/Vma6
MHDTAVMPTWTDLASRVRGLGSRLVGRAELERLATSRDLVSMTAELAGTAYAGVANDDTMRCAATIERDMRRAAGERLTMIAHWAGDRAALLSPVFEDEDRRNLRALTRSIAAQTPVEQRLGGLLPTAALPSPALEQLAAATCIREFAATLTSWGNSYGRVILAESLRPHPEVFLLQLAIDREYANRTLDAALHTGEPLRGYLRMQIDVENARIALAAASGELAHEPDGLFITGGDAITLDLFRTLAASTEGDARARLSRVVAGTVLAPIVPEGRDDGDAALLTALLRDMHRTVRLEPLSLAVVLEYVLRLRAELQDLSRIVWGLAMQLPRRRIIAKLVTP